MEVPAGIKAVGDLRRAENKNLVQIDFVNPFQTSGSLMPVYLNTIQSGKIVFWFIQSPVHKKA